MAIWLSTTAIAKLEGVTSQTVRRWVKSGKYETKLTDGGHIRIKRKQERRILYARVSSRKQLSSIESQKEQLLMSYPDGEFEFDIASAFNFQRKSLRRILEFAIKGDSIEIVVTNRDRLARSGFGLIQWIVELSGGKIISLNDEAKTENFDTQELVGFITSFCNSYYGKRSARNKKNKNIS